MVRSTNTNGHKTDTRDRAEYFREYNHDRRADVKAKLAKWQGRKHRCPTCKGDLSLGRLDGKTKQCVPGSEAELQTGRCPRWRTADHYRLVYKG